MDPQDTSRKVILKRNTCYERGFLNSGEEVTLAKEVKPDLGKRAGELVRAKDV